uniref:Uncharacterized protein n=1 Tax=Opuntia streptacantha TaxID=393608 RepID=A0A7C9DZE0_OPUST
MNQINVVAISLGSLLLLLLLGHQLYILEGDSSASMPFAAIQLYGNICSTCPFYVFIQHITHLHRRFHILTRCLLVTIVLINYYRVGNVLHQNVLKYDVFGISAASLPSFNSDTISGS